MSRCKERQHVKRALTLRADCERNVTTNGINQHCMSVHRHSWRSEPHGTTMITRNFGDHVRIEASGYASPPSCSTGPTRRNAVDRPTARSAQRRLPAFRSGAGMARGGAVRRGRHVLRGRGSQRARRRDPPQRTARRRQRSRSDGTDAHELQQTGDRRDCRLRGRGRPRTGRDVRSAGGRRRCRAGRVLPAGRHSADRRRHDPLAATDRAVARARSDSDRARGRCAGSARLRSRQPRRDARAKRARRPNNWPPNWRRFRRRRCWRTAARHWKTARSRISPRRCGAKARAAIRRYSHEGVAGARVSPRRGRHGISRRQHTRRGLTAPATRRSAQWLSAKNNSLLAPSKAVLT